MSSSSDRRYRAAVRGRQIIPGVQSRIARMVLLNAAAKDGALRPSDAFDGGDFGAVGWAAKSKTSAPSAVEHHRASAADAMLAADVSSDQTKIVAQKINQGGRGSTAAACSDFRLL